MKKTTLAAIVVVGILLLGSSGVYAAGQIARSNAITEDDAINFACVDAGISPDQVTITKSEFDFENGKFVYEIEFVEEGVGYEYVIDSMSGQILDRSFDRKVGFGVNSGQNNVGNTNNSPNTGGSSVGVNSSDIIGIEKAKSIALNSAGFNENEVVFSKAKLERENGKVVYDIDFYVYDKAEYNYEIDAVTGSIVEEGFEAWEDDD